MNKRFQAGQPPHHNENHLKKAMKSPIFVWCGGQSLMEILVGLGIISIMVGASTYALVTVLRSSNITEQSQSAGLIGNSLLESASTLAEANWNAVYNLQKTLSNKYFLVRSPTTTPTAVPGYESILEQEITYGLVGHWKFDEGSGTAAYDSSGAGNLGVLTNIPDINSGLVGYWKFDEGSGSTATDFSGGNHTGTLVNSPVRNTYKDCKFSGCLGFNGISNYVGSVTGIQFGSSDFTISAWVNPSTLSSVGDVLSDSNTNVILRMGGEYGSRAILFLNGWTNYLYSGSLNAGAWNYLVYVKQGQTLHVYINSVLADSSSSGVIPVTVGSMGALNIGYLSSYFSGKMDDFRIYSRALSVSEISRLYNMNNCRVGNCLAFDGTNQYIDTGNNSSLNISSPITYAAWVKPTTFDTSAVYYFMSKGNASSGISLGFIGTYEPANQGKAILFNGSFSIYSSNAVSVNQWHYIVATNNGINSCIYIDGALSNCGAQTLSNSASLNFAVGRRQDVLFYFPGLMDDVRVYNRALSATEVYQLYNSPVYSRYFYVDNVNRTACGTGGISTNAATTCTGSANDIGEDSATQKITVGTSWNLKGANETLENSIFVTRWINSITEQSDWGGSSGTAGAVSDFGNNYYEYSTISTTTAGSIKISGI